MKEEGRGGGSGLGSDLDLDPDPRKILWIRIGQNDAHPLDWDPDPKHWPRWVRIMEKNRGQKSHDTASLIMGLGSIGKINRNKISRDSATSIVKD